MRVFLAVCRQGSFSGAGAVLGLATSTVSRRVDLLEARLGARLLERSTRGLSRTEAGQVLWERAQQAEAALEEAEDAVRALMRHPAGRLRVAVPSAILRGVVGDVALDYLREFPDVSLELVGADADEALVPDGTQLHLVVRASRKPPPQHLMQRALGKIPMVICASPGWLAQHPAPTLPEDLARHGCIVLGGEPAAAARIRLLQGREQRTLTVPVALFTTSIAMARRAGLAGLGPVGLPAASCADLLASGALCPLLPGWTLEPVSIIALYTGDRQLPLRVRTFLDRLSEALAKIES